MQTFFYHVFAERNGNVAYRRRVDCNDRLHFMNKLNRWNRLSAEQTHGFVYVALVDGDMQAGSTNEYVVPIVSPDIYLDATSAR